MELQFVSLDSYSNLSGILTSSIIFLKNIASGESDFVAQTMNLTFTAAQQPQTVMISILDDAYLEINEHFNCTLTLAGTYDPSIQVYPALATVTIIDNDSELYRA